MNKPAGLISRLTGSLGTSYARNLRGVRAAAPRSVAAAPLVLYRTGPRMVESKRQKALSALHGVVGQVNDEMLRLGISHHIRCPTELKIGDHVYVWRTGGVYAHHGIVTAEAHPSMDRDVAAQEVKVIEFAAPRNQEGVDVEDDQAAGFEPTLEPERTSWLSKVGVGELQASRARIQIVSLGAFSKGMQVRLVRYSSTGWSSYFKLRGTTQPNTPDDPETVVARAVGVLSGDIPWGKYDVVHNNCEHFATWCRTGVPRSSQVEDNILAKGGKAVQSGMRVASSTVQSARSHRNKTNTYSGRPSSPQDMTLALEVGPNTQPQPTRPLS